MAGSICLRDVLPVADQPHFEGEAIADIRMPAEDLAWRRQALDLYTLVFHACLEKLGGLNILAGSGSCSAAVRECVAQGIMKQAAADCCYKYIASSNRARHDSHFVVVPGQKYLLHQADDHSHVRIRDFEKRIVACVPNCAIVKALSQDGSRAHVKVVVDSGCGECQLYGWVEVRNLRKCNQPASAPSSPPSAKRLRAEE